jgi:hypothetical protein
MKLTRADDAVAIFTGGLSCSQAVCSAYAEDFEIDRTTAVRLSCGLGSGWATPVTPAVR